MTWILDLETDALWPEVSKIHCAVLRCIETDQVVQFVPNLETDNFNNETQVSPVGVPIKNDLKFLSGWLKRYCLDGVLSCHNGIGFDLKILHKLMNYEHKGEYFDTLLASRVLWPDIEGGHSVDAWAKRFGLEKPKHEDWSKFSEDMLIRCTEDTKIQAELYRHIQQHVDDVSMNDKRVDFNKVFRLEHKVWEIMEAQRDYGWQMDLEHAYRTKDIIEKEYKELEEQLIKSLPIRVIKPKTEVTKAFKANGDMTVAADNWFVQNYRNLPLYNIGTIDGDFCKVGFQNTNPGSPDQIKEYLLSQGWQPLNWNYKKDRYKKAIKDKWGKKIKTSPKMPKDEEWDVIEQITDNDKIKLVAKFYVVRHRRGLINSFIEHCNTETHRIHYDVITCGTNCVVAGTLIQTDCGLIPIEQAQKGDLVITHEGKYERCIDFINNGIQPVYRITTDTGREIVCTENHPFWTGLHFVECRDLLPGNFISTYSDSIEWRKYPKGDYYVSNTGLIQNFEGYYLGAGSVNKERRRTLHIRGQIDLYVNGKVTKKRMGSIVLETFIGERPEGKECCHKDGNPTNNHIENLYWGTSKENTADQILHGRLLKVKRESKYTKLTQEQVDEIRCEYENNFYKGIYTSLGKKYNVSRKTISGICLEQRWTRRTETLKYRYKILFGSEKIESVEYIGEMPTFDLTVENDHSYVANGFVTHNTSRMQHRIVVNVPRVE